MADSVTISSSKMPFEILMVGTRPRGLMERYSCERGLERSMRTSSWGRLRHSRVMAARWAQGQTWEV